MEESLDMTLNEMYTKGFNSTTDPLIQKDSVGYFIESLSENQVVYLDDYYRFLEIIHARCEKEIEKTRVQLIELVEADSPELTGYLSAKIIIQKHIVKTIIRFYTEKSLHGVIMTPWCFGTIMLEKVEVLTEKIRKGEVSGPDIGKYPFYVLQYLDEASKNILLDTFSFPPKAFECRWQYTTILKRYAEILEDIRTTLNRVINKLPHIE